MSSNTPSSSPVSVIGSQFMVPHQIDLIIDKKSEGILVFTDMDHPIMLKVIRCNSSFHRQRVLLDARNKTVVTIREKMISAHYRWNVSRGSGSDLIFTTKKANMIHSTNISVFLENKNSHTDVCDFTIEGSWSQSNFAIYIGETSTAIAQMYRTASSENFEIEKLMVRINAAVDYAFVVTLIAIVEAMEFESDRPAGKTSLCTSACIWKFNR